MSSRPRRPYCCWPATTSTTTTRNVNMSGVSSRTLIKSVMKSLGYKCHPMASGGSVPRNIQSSEAAWPQIGVKAVALIDKRIGGIDLLSRLDILPSQSAYRSSDLVTRQDLQRVSRILCISASY